MADCSQRCGQSYGKPTREGGACGLASGKPWPAPSLQGQDKEGVPGAQRGPLTGALAGEHINWQPVACQRRSPPPPLPFPHLLLEPCTGQPSRKPGGEGTLDTVHEDQQPSCEPGGEEGTGYLESDPARWGTSAWHLPTFRTLDVATLARHNS